MSEISIVFQNRIFVNDNLPIPYLIKLNDINLKTEAEITKEFQLISDEIFINPENSNKIECFTCRITHVLEEYKKQNPNLKYSIEECPWFNMPPIY